MTIGDGVTTITIENDNVNEEDMPTVDKSSRTTAGGSIKSQTAGERVVLDVMVRVTKAELRSLFTLLTNGADEYYYSPKHSTEYATLYPTLADPFKVSVENIRKTTDNMDRYYMSFRADAVDYL